MESNTSSSNMISVEVVEVKSIVVDGDRCFHEISFVNPGGATCTYLLKASKYSKEELEEAVRALYLLHQTNTIQM